MTTKTEEQNSDISVREWMEEVIRPEDYEKYLIDGKDFIDDELIEQKLAGAKNPAPEYIREIIAKARSLERLEPEETAALVNLSPEATDLWEEIYAACKEIKEQVYGTRIVTFAPLYVSNYCVNNCTYCGYRTSNTGMQRSRLSDEELRAEVRALVEEGHKRLIMVYGEHPLSDADYMAHTLQVAYDTKVDKGEIRRANVNAAPLSTENLRMLKDVGIGTYQVFQETYHHQTYAEMHPSGLKADYRWRLYSLHRSLEAGADDVGMGALFGLYDWQFEVMGLLYHTIDLERHFDGVGPHTISFPRLEPALNTPFNEASEHLVDDDTFKRIVAILRLSVPYTGMILTARETPQIREDVLELGITQLDFGSNIGVGQYSKHDTAYNRQQFQLSDSRSLDEGIRWLAEQGHLTSFCTAGYRCGRTGHYFMDIAKQGKVHHLCMPNAILTFKEYLLDYASPETQKAGEHLIEKETAKLPEEMQDVVQKYLHEIETGERDRYV